MARRRKEEDLDSFPDRPPASTPEGRESQLTAYALDLAEKQLRDGTASAQVISHYLKLGSSRERLEQDRLARENELLRAKVAQLESSGSTEALYEKAIRAMKQYQGRPDDEEDYDSDV